MTGRRVCAKCGASYHTVYNPSKDPKNCDKCGEELTIRKDDAPEVVKSRLATYHEQTEPLKEYYSARPASSRWWSDRKRSLILRRSLSVSSKRKKAVNNDIGKKL